MRCTHAIAKAVDAFCKPKLLLPGAHSLFTNHCRRRLLARGDVHRRPPAESTAALGRQAAPQQPQQRDQQEQQEQRLLLLAQLLLRLRVLLVLVLQPEQRPLRPRAVCPPASLASTVAKDAAAVGTVLSAARPTAVLAAAADAAAAAGA